jgi:putative flippase GtrA
MSFAQNPRFQRFLLVGIAGFLADAAVLALMLRLGVDPFLGRIVSIAVAMVLTWRLNRAFTFAPGPRSQVAEGSRYALVVAAASGINWLVYSALLLLLPGTPPHLALAVGSVVALGFSYTGFARFAFR